MQNRASEYHLILNCQELSHSELEEIFSQMPQFVPQEQPKQIFELNTNALQNIQAQTSQKQTLQKELLNDNELKISLDYSNSSAFELQGSLVVQNNTVNNIYNVTALLIGINCPSLDFSPCKISQIEGKQSQRWDFRIVRQNGDENLLKLKYVVRFFYNSTYLEEDYR